MGIPADEGEKFTNSSALGMFACMSKRQLVPRSEELIGTTPQGVEFLRASLPR